MTEIPEDVMQAAREAYYGRHERGFICTPLIGETDTPPVLRIARAILAEREKSRKRVEELEAWVASRDKFIVDQGLWSDFVETLPLRKTPQTFKRLSLRKEGTDA